ncbi:MAG: orotidine 5'-phosphate decarboxylase [Bacillaceae bacterium G1]|nr:orotidine-5'-phosphate decarboxylase [Bacillota bacterium]OJF17456.1 MAG: orotidine 5'-phosphate decarboxylase [Bacillaceae bacterium G1]
MSMAERVIIALDFPTAGEALAFLDRVPQVRYVKVGMELFYAAGTTLLEQLKRRGLRIFLDLKLHDIPNTVGRAMAVLAGLGVDMLNVHAAGGREMMLRAKEGVEKGVPAGQPAPRLIAVTQLTSTDQQVLNEELGIPGSVEEAVLRYARLAKQCGLDGVVASPWEVGTIKEACGPAFLCVTPGVRPQAQEDGQRRDDQRRIMTPQEAWQAGSDYLVVGRPVTRASDPAQAFADIVAQLHRP